MKTKTILFHLLIISILTTTAQTKSFTLKGNMEGLQKGDTLFLMTYQIPEWQPEKTDTIFVKQDNSISHIQPMLHSQFYLLRYAPKDKEPLPTSILGIPIFAKPNDTISLNGSTEFFGAATKTGGDYDIPLIRKQDSLTSRHDKQGIIYIRKAIYAQRANQPDSASKYGGMYNMLRRDSTLKQIHDSVTYKINDNEFAAVQFLMENSEWNYTDGNERYKHFTPQVQSSFYGKRIADIVKRKKKLEPGETPPDFTFITTTGKHLSLSNFYGKHLLLYWWGMCPASFQINPKLVEMYKKYHANGLEIIGITRENIRAFQSQMPAENEKQKEELNLFFNPLWNVVYETEEGNRGMVANYNFNGLPTVMLISPEGITLFRGYNDYEGLEKAFLNSVDKNNKTQ